MKFWKLASVATVLVLSTNVNAALIERLGGQAYYDDVADLTWLADANYAYTSGYVDTISTFYADGKMKWADANEWAAQLTVGGVDGWRLPDTLQPDESCSIQSGASAGFNCTGSEMGNLFYNVLGGSAQVGLTINHNTNYELFTNIQYYYWSATEENAGPAYDADAAWFFDILSGSYVGSQYLSAKSNHFSAWAVQSGDVSAVPVPAAVWLFGCGLLSLIGVARRKDA